MNKRIVIVCVLLLVAVSLFVTGCGRKSADNVVIKEDVEAKAMLQGIWLDEISESVAFKVDGDTIFYSDSTSQPACL